MRTGRAHQGVGAGIFSPPRLLGQEPRGEQRQGLVRVPGDPVPHLIIPQARLALGALETVLDPMRRLGHTRQLLQRHTRIGVGKIRVMFERPVRWTLPREEQDLLRARPAGRRPRLHPALHHVHRQGALLAVADLEGRPHVLRQRRTPAIQAHERGLGMPPASRVFRRGRLAVADQRVRGDRSQVPLAAAAQGRAKARGTAPLVVARHPGVRQERTVFVQHLPGQFVAGAERGRLGDPGRATPPAIRRPFLGEIKASVDDCMFFSRYVCHVDPNLAVLDLAEAAAPLPRHAHRLSPLRGEGRGIEHDHPVGFAQVVADLSRRVVSRG